MEASLTSSLLIAATVGLASGAIGAFIVLKRMALVGDALSHVALPGIALALLWNFDPFWGVVVFLVIAAVVIWWLEDSTRLPADAVVGILFTASLAIGILTIPNTELVESLFGGFPAMSLPLLFLICVLALVLTVLTFRLSRQFAFSLLSPDLARVENVGKIYDLMLLLIFSLVVALGIKLVGTLLMGALVIIPASIAKNMCKSLQSYLFLAAVLGAGVAIAGVLTAARFAILPGPTIILLGVMVFLVTLVLAKRQVKS
jgi:ABC-type Mn2+/Zn2+ transport system permease subunit